MQRLLSFFRLLTLSRVAVSGAILTTAAFLTYLILAFSEVFLFEGNPYWGIILNMVFPAIGVFGLILIAVGLFLKIRALGTGFSFSALEGLAVRQKIKHRYVWQVATSLTLCNLLFLALFTYRGYHFTESREFCGELCHVVMEPEYTVYQHSPHSEISCVDCHIGSGATWFVKSKLSGMRQVYGVLTGSYSRPIETPVHNLRPARDVCEVCHRPEIFHGDRIRVIEAFAPDRENSLTYTVLNMRVGSGGERTEAHGIHWHVSREQTVRYHASDERREKIDWISLTGPDGSQRVWTRPDQEISEPDLDPQAIRTMDCIDCH
ncbi:MAG: NapC/NirT family cytochrome c, partial [bacterium]